MKRAVVLLTSVHSLRRGGCDAPLEHGEDPLRAAQAGQEVGGGDGRSVPTQGTTAPVAQALGRHRWRYCSALPQSHCLGGAVAEMTAYLFRVQHPVASGTFFAAAP